MKRRLRVMITFASVLTLTIAVALPVLALPPVHFDQPDFLLVHDFENDKIMFWNITRDDFCAEQDAPDLPATFHETGNGDSFYAYAATRGLELWEFTDPGGEFGPCAGTESESGPWATGNANASLRDYFPSGDRPFEMLTTVRLNGTVMDGSLDQWRYTFSAADVIDGDFSNGAGMHFNLTQMGT
jgi:hypothetical protein